MEFQIERARFQLALERIQGIVDRRNTMPVLANVLVRVCSDSVIVAASDLEIAFSGTYPCKGIVPGAITIAARQLNEIVRNLPHEKIHIRLMDNNSIEITSGRSYFRLVGLSADGYPEIPEFENLVEFKIKAGVLKEMIEYTSFSIASDDSRYGLNGAYFERDDRVGSQGVRMISTDGHRLSLINRKVEGLPDFEKGYLLPRKGLIELKKLLDELKDSEVAMSFSSNATLIRNGDDVFYMRLLEGDFPDYHQVIPQKFLRKALVKRDDLTKALKRVSILSSEKTHSVRFSFHADDIEVSASSPDMGESREAIAAQVEGGDVSIGFNARYFLDALAVITTEMIEIQLGDSLNPGVIRTPGSDDITFVVMPMRLE